MLIMGAMMLNAVNIINRISHKNSKDPNDCIVALHLVMIFFAFAGAITMWTLFAVAWYADYLKHDPDSVPGRETREYGILVGNIGLFIATLVLLYIFWGYGVNSVQQELAK